MRDARIRHADEESGMDTRVPQQLEMLDSASPPQSAFLRRALLIIHCARELPGASICPETGQINLKLSARQFEAELRRRYGKSHPDLVFRADSTFERARLDRHRYKDLPRVVLRQGPPPKSERPSHIFAPID
jgi:hypothetical protein